MRCSTGRTLLLSLALLEGGCLAPGPITLPATMPEAGVLLGPDAGGAQRALAFEGRPDQAPLWLTWPGEQLLLLEYDRELNAVGLAAGPLSFASHEPRRHLSIPARAYTRSVDDGAEVAWLPIDPAKLHDDERYLAFWAESLAPADCVDAGGCYAEGDDTDPCVRPCPQPARPTEPTLPEPPSFLPCPSGWIERTRQLGEGSTVVWCDAAPTPEQALPCTGSERFVAGQGCTPFGPSCTLDFAPAPPGSTAIYVRPGAIGGDGSLVSPYGSLEQALAAPAPSVILLGRSGSPLLLSGPLEIDGPLRLIGACPAESRIIGHVVVKSSTLSLQALAVEGGLGVEAGSRLELAGVIVRGTSAYAVQNNRGTLIADELLLEGTFGGIFSASGTVSIAHATLQNMIDHPLFVEAGQLTATDIFVLSGRAAMNGLLFDHAHVVLRRVLVEGVTGTGVNLRASFADLEDVVVRHGRIGAGGDDRYGFWIGSYNNPYQGGRVTGRRLVVVDQADPIVRTPYAIKLETLQEIELSHLLIIGAAPYFGAGVVMVGSRAKLDHVAIERARGLGIEFGARYNTDLEAEDVIIDGTRRIKLLPAVGGHAIQTYLNSTFRLRRAWLGRGDGIGFGAEPPPDDVGATEPGSIRIEDLTVERQLFDGIRVTGETDLTADRVVLLHNSGDGARLYSGRIRFSNLRVEGTVGSTITENCLGACAGLGVYAANIVDAEVEQFELVDNLDVAAAILHGDGARLLLQRGVIRNRLPMAGAAFLYDFNKQDSCPLPDLLRGVVVDGVKPLFDPLSHCESE